MKPSNIVAVGKRWTSSTPPHFKNYWNNFQSQSFLVLEEQLQKLEKYHADVIP